MNNSAEISCDGDGGRYSYLWRRSLQLISRCDCPSNCDRSAPMHDFKFVKRASAIGISVAISTFASANGGGGSTKRPWTDAQWKEYAAAPELRTFAAYYDDALAGYYELRRDAEGGVEIAYLGLLPEFVGGGLGGALLTSAIEEAWQMSPRRVWVHTCNRDHPQALANYQARGMLVFKIEETQA
jgi:GNAT superfamily N-acetyltransferase